MRKKLPVGIDGFEKIRTNDFYYVDKTMFIADLLHNWGEVNLFTRPRRFGKSLSVSMLKAFFEIGTDPSLFDGLKIMQEEELCEKYMGKFPVILLTLKGVDGLCYRDACAALKTIIGKEALRFRFLADSDKLSEEEKALYLQLIQVGTSQNTIFSMSDEILVDSLRTLSQLLEKHYGQKVIILIDEYDVPLDKSFQGGYYNEMVSLIRNVFGNVLKTNDSLYFAVLTGCLRISKESIFTGLNNLKVHTITDIRYDEYFGFTDKDVREILAFYGLKNHEATIKEWYDGYQFGNVSVYCPWDVINYCDALLACSEKNMLPQNYWANTSGNVMIRRFIDKADRKTRNEIEMLVSGKSIVKPINQELTYDELDNSLDNLWSVLFTTGYLTQKGRDDSEDGIERYRLTIPNREIRSLFITQIQTWFKETTQDDPLKMEEFCLAFPKGDEEKIEKILRDYLWKSISIRDTASRKQMKENFYHGMLLGLLQYESDWLIQSNAELGEGYCDISIITPERIGVIIELKYAEDGNLIRSCKKALEQIKEKQYDTALVDEGMEQLVKYGISFYKKNCKVIMER